VDLLGGIGGAVALLGAMLLLGHVAVPSLRRVINVLTAALAQDEAMTLTAYTAHVVFMNSPLDVFDPVFQVVAVLPFSLGWRRAVGRGPALDSHHRGRRRRPVGLSLCHPGVTARTGWGPPSKPPDR
jgi:hypothetical protein